MSLFWHLMCKRSNGNSLNKFQETALAIAGDKDNQISQSLRDTEMQWTVAYRGKTCMCKSESGLVFTVMDGEHGTKVTANQRIVDSKGSRKIFGHAIQLL